MYIGNRKTPMEVLEKKVPKNPKYANVKGHLDTGRTMKKIKPISTKQFVKRRNEIFKRVHPNELADTLQADIGAHGNQSNNQEDSHQVKSCLLLDVRDEEEFDACKIVGAMNFTLAEIHRDRFPPELFHFKNKVGRTIVVYDDDERVSSRAAKEMLEKGFENVRLLSYGLKGFGNHFPEYIEGELPSHLVKAKSPSPTHSTRGSRRYSESIRDSRSTYADSVSGFSSTYSVSSRGSTFARAPRFAAGRNDKQRHKEIMNRINRGSLT